MDEIQKVLIEQGRKDLAQKYYKKHAAVRHRLDSNKNVETKPADVMEEIASGIQSLIDGSAVDTKGYSIVMDIDTPSVTSLELIFDYQRIMGDYSLMKLYAVTSLGKRNFIQSWEVPNGVYYSDNTESWWLGANEPSRINPNNATKAIDSFIKTIQSYLKSYIPKLKRSPGSADLQIALKLNKALKLKLDEKALAKLFAAMAD